MTYVTNTKSQKENHQKIKVEEKRITEAVARLLGEQTNIEHRYEVQFCSKYLDLYSYDKDNSSFIAVESKVNAVSRAFQQAEIYLHLAGYVYVAIMKNKSNKRATELAKNTGIGLILIEVNELNQYVANVFIPAEYSSMYNNRLSHQTWTQATNRDIHG